MVLPSLSMADSRTSTDWCERCGEGCHLHRSGWKAGELMVGLRVGGSVESKGEIRFKLVSKSADEVVSEMPVEKGILNPFGIVNAGAILWFADVTASMLILGSRNPTEGMEGFPLAINLNANFISNRKDGTFFATSTYVKQGKTVSVVRTRVADAEQNVIADVTTNHVLSK